MKTVNVHFYYLGRKKDDNNFKGLLIQKTGWPPEKIDEFLSKNDTAIFYKKPVDEAIDLIRAFQQAGVIGAINGLDHIPYYTKQFQKFYENGGRFRLAWNWASAILSGLWQLCRGLWAKALLYGGISILLSWLFRLIPGQILGRTGMTIFSLAFWIGHFCFYGLVSNYDYFLKKTRNENLWSSFPYKKYKILFWILTFAGLSAWLTLFGIQTKNFLSMRHQMKNPTISKGEAMQFEGIEFSPLPGWRVISSFPGNFQPSFFGGSQVKTMFFIMGQQTAGEQSKTSKASSQLTLSVYPPKGKASYHSLDQKEVREVIEPTVKAFDQKMFKLVLKDMQTSEPVFIEVNGQKWAKIATIIRFRSTPPETTFLNVVYYTIINNKVVTLYLQGFLGGQEEMEKDIEQFARTFKSPSAV